jgi:predicted nucleotide-binding protein
LLKAAYRTIEDFHEVNAPLRRESLPPKADSNKVFVVHGHDEAAKQSVARFLEKCGLAAVILHEQINRGKTIIEKFEHFSDVGFAVVLLTPDDAGRANTKEEFEHRARQNVVFEFGYFIAKLGRDRVCALHKGNVELPTDVSGFVYVQFDEGGAWKNALLGELRAAGYQIDANHVF